MKIWYVLSTTFLLAVVAVLSVQLMARQDELAALQLKIDVANHDEMESSPSPESSVDVVETQNPVVEEKVKPADDHSQPQNIAPQSADVNESGTQNASQPRRVAEWQPRRSEKDMALLMANEFIKRSLKSPSSASFPTMSDARGVSVTSTRRRIYQVNAYVDAQNSFGAMIRQNYSAVVRQNSDGTWSIISSQINE